MADQFKRVAVDTSVVLDYLLDEDTELADRAEYLLAGHADRHTVVLPAIVIAEIGGAPSVRGDHIPKPERQRRITRAMEWIRNSNFVVAEISERTARRAADIAVEYGLKGPDAAILASAEEWACDRLYARDDDLLKCNGQFAFTISEPDDPPEPEPNLFTL
ncbi:type II toxin-antitoxin system VapC family toxin [Mycolicibacterium obuense]|uniref:Ribonuclease VapC n=1 Tax=Mycolicibacterium obuense TaxID=1807 RepID=A0A4R5X6I8_9MYCO|nr:PIN domain-containing protein [Mycolicibacterium obuense]TDL08422.1 type II toxin-antitoxin system VapC family toxin [Mycolicibacterium obuense]